MRPSPVVSIVCHVIAQGVCAGETLMHPTSKQGFLFFFSIGGLLEAVEDLYSLDNGG